MIYVAGCVDWAKLVPSWGYIGGLWGYLGLPWGHPGLRRSHLGTTLGGIWAHPRVQVLGFGHHNAYPFEMPKSLSPRACAAKTLARKTMMLSSIEITHLKNMPKSLSPYACSENACRTSHKCKKPNRCQAKMLTSKCKHCMLYDIQGSLEGD